MSLSESVWVWVGMGVVWVWSCGVGVGVSGGVGGDVRTAKTIRIAGAMLLRKKPSHLRRT